MSRLQRSRVLSADAPFLRLALKELVTMDIVVNLHQPQLIGRIDPLG